MDCADSFGGRLFISLEGVLFGPERGPQTGTTAAGLRYTRTPAFLGSGFPWSIRTQALTKAAAYN